MAISNISGALITKGFGYDACQALITSQFHLIGCKLTIKVHHGGSKLLKPGEFKNFYKPVDPDLFKDLDPSLMDHPIIVDEPITVKDLITVRIKFRSHEIEKEYAVPKHRTKHIVKVLNIFNSTTSRMKAIISGINVIRKRLIAKISNFNHK